MCATPGEGAAEKPVDATCLSGKCTSSIHGGGSTKKTGSHDKAKLPSGDPETHEPLGTEFNLKHNLLATDGAKTRKEYKTDVTSLAGGGSASDRLKVTVVGVSYDRDIRDPTTGKEKIMKVSLTADTTMSVVMGSEHDRGGATLCMEINDKAGHSDLYSPLARLPSDLKHIPSAFVKYMVVGAVDVPNYASE